MKPSVNKKPLLGILVATALMVGGVQFAYAHGHGGYGQDDAQYQNRDCQQRNQMMDKTDTKINTEALQKFLDTTTELRKSYTQKRAEMKAVMRSETPDVASAGKIAGELFDIRENLIKKAKENDLKVPVATAGVGYPGSNVHAPNENMDIENFIAGVRHTIRIMDSYSRGP